VNTRPVYEDSIGAQLLTDVLTFPSNIKERHDTLEFINHMYITHTVRLVVEVGVPAEPSARGSIAHAPYRAWGQGSLENDHGQMVVPLGFLDRHSRATTHVTDEAGKVVPLFTAGDLNHRLGSGLVCYAMKILDSGLTPLLTQHLREIPAHAEALQYTAEVSPQEAADEAFDKACEALLRFEPAGFLLLRELAFRHALAVVTCADQLLVEVDPSPDARRVFTYSYVRPINPPLEPLQEPSGGRIRRLGIKLTRRALSAYKLARRYVKRSGTMQLDIDLGPLGSCERYHLSAEAPFDTWFAKASLERDDGAGEPPPEVDISQQFRLDYRQNSTSTPWSGRLSVELRTVLTGLARAGFYASLFFATCVLAGFLRVIFASDHVLLDENVEAAASLLLLFPGLTASAVARSTHTLTLTLQFPTRLILFGLAVLSFILAVSSAFELGGIINVVLWAVSLGVSLTAAGLLYARSRAWNQRRRVKVD
jgi:hypothetical protein